METMTVALANRIEKILGNAENVPDHPWIMFQSWRKLLFMHWPVAAEVIRPHVPAGMELDAYEGQTWLTMIPMHMVDVHLRDLPPVPFNNTFPEINFRTYVRVNGEPGIYFFSIDAHAALSVWVARHFFYLPYLQADMSFKALTDNQYEITCQRVHSNYAKAAQFSGRFQPHGEPFISSEGSLDRFLVERYDFFVEHSGKMYRGKIQHAPWELQQVTAEIEINTVPQAIGFDLPVTAPTLLYADRTDVLCWALAEVD